MKKNSFIKKVMFTSLAVVLLAIPTLSFADVAAGRTTAMDKVDMRIEDAGAQFEEKAADVLAKRDAYRAKMTEIIGAFAPDMQSDFDTLWATHDELHTALIAEHKRIISQKQAETKAVFDDVKAAVASGDMTRIEAKATLTSHKEALEADRNATQAKIDELKATYNVPEGTVKALNQALKAAVESGDATAVANALSDILNSLTQHLTFDQAKLDYLQTK
ncbi:hypothetical protein [Fusibacter bizertensis]